MKKEAPFECVLRVPFSSAEKARTAAKSLEKEIGFRSKCAGSAECEESVLVVRIEADNLASLHASANSALRLLKVVNAALAIAKGGTKFGKC